MIAGCGKTPVSNPLEGSTGSPSESDAPNGASDIRQGIAMPTPTSTPTPTFTPTPTYTPTPTSNPLEGSTGSPSGQGIAMPTPTDTPTPTSNPLEGSTGSPSEQGIATITMTGDILMHTRVEKDCKQADGSYDYRSIFANTKDYISSFDIAMVNQEVIIGGSALGISGYPDFNASEELADALVDAGFDVVLHATNHALDKGKNGVLNCLENWKRFPNMIVLGIYATEEDAENQIAYIEKNGIKIAILNFTYGTNGHKNPSTMPWAVGPMLPRNPNSESNSTEVAKVTALIDKAVANSDFTVVCPHWGTEYTNQQDSAQRAWNRIFYEHGVDLVIGAHPHVIQPVVVVDEKSTYDPWELGIGDEGPRTVSDGRMLVFYSLGNFVNWTEESGEKVLLRMVGGMPEITLGRDENGNVIVKDYSITAVVCHVQTGKNAVTVYKMSDYTEELAAANEIRSGAGKALTIEYCTELLNRVWRDAWK